MASLLNQQIKVDSEIITSNYVHCNPIIKKRTTVVLVN